MFQNSCSYQRSHGSFVADDPRYHLVAWYGFYDCDEASDAMIRLIGGRKTAIIDNFSLWLRFYMGVMVRSLGPLFMCCLELMMIGSLGEGRMIGRHTDFLEIRWPVHGRASHFGTLVYCHRLVSRYCQ